MNNICYPKIGLFVFLLLFQSCFFNNYKPDTIIHNNSKTDIKPCVLPEAYIKPEDKNEHLNSYYYFIKSQIEKTKGNLAETARCLLKSIELDPDSLYLKNELVLIYLSQKNLNSAFYVAKKMLIKEPANVQVLKLYARICYLIGKVETAKKTYVKIIARDPKQKNIYLALANVHMEQQDYNNAAVTCKQLLKHFPKSFVGHFFLGKIYAKQKKLAKAKKEFVKTIKLQPTLVEPKFELIDLYKLKQNETIIVKVKEKDSVKKICLKLYGKYTPEITQAILKSNKTLKDINNIYLGQTLLFPRLWIDKDKKTIETQNQHILDLCQEILQIDPDNIKAAIELGFIYYKNNDISKAEKLFYQLAQKSLADKEIIGTIVQLYLKTKQYDIVKAVLKGMLKSLPENSDIHFIAGITYYETNELKKAAQHFIKVLPDSTYRSNALIQTSFILKEQGKIYQAIKILQKAALEKPDNTEIFFYLGSFYEEIEEFCKAAEILNKGIKLEPENTRLYYRIGVIYDKNGLKDSSIEAMKNVIRLDPQNANALNYLGYTYADLNKNLDEAESLIKKALEFKPNDGYIIDSLGWIYYKKGLYQKSLEYLKRAVEIVPDDPIILEHLGDIYLKINNKINALKFFRLSLTKSAKKNTDLENKIRQLTEKLTENSKK